MATLRKVTVAESGDYATVAAAYAGLVATYGTDLVADDEIWEIEITGSWTNADTGNLYINVPTTGASNYIYIHASGNARHGGKWSTTAHRMVVSGGGIFVRTTHCRIDGLQVQRTGTAGPTVHMGYALDMADGRISNTLIRGSDGGGYALRLTSASGGTVHCWNNIVYDVITTASTDRGITADGNAAGTRNIYNTVVIGGYYGIMRSSGTVVVKNCYAGGASAPGSPTPMP